MGEKIANSPISKPDSNQLISDNLDEFTDIDIKEHTQEPELNSVSHTSLSPENPAASDTVPAEGVLYPHENLPRPEPPTGLSNDDASEPKHIDMPSSIGEFLRKRTSSLSAAIARKLSLDDVVDPQNHVVEKPPQKSTVTEFTLSGVRVIVESNSDSTPGNGDVAVPSLKGRVTFFSRSNCRDSTAVRSFIRNRRLRFTEINVDVYRSREKELIERTGKASVPSIFFNGELIGGLGELNEMRKSGRLEEKLTEMLAGKCPEGAPAEVEYGVDDVDEEEEREDEVARVARVARQRVPVREKVVRMRRVKNCFCGCELVEVLIHHLDCGRKKAVQIGKELARKHFIHSVSGGNDFEDGNELYRFLEHEPFIQKCYNFRGCSDEREPKPAVIISERLTKIMYAILESYASEDRLHLNYLAISNSEEFRRYLNLVQGLHRVNIKSLNPNEKLAFFMNLYNAMVIHAVIRIGTPAGIIERKSFVSDFQYLVGGQAYSLSAIRNGILRGNRRPPYSLVKPFSSGDSRLQLVLSTVNPMIHFGLCDGTKSSPPVRFFAPDNVEAELRVATREFFHRGGVEVDLSKRTVYLTPIINWFDADFGSEREILKWIMNYLDATKAGLLTHLLNDGGGFINIAFQKYDWSANL